MLKKLIFVVCAVLLALVFTICKEPDETWDLDTESQQNAILLTENVWANGNLPTSSDRQWFTFTATADSQYLHFDSFSPRSLYVNVYSSSGTMVGSGTVLSSYNEYISRTLTPGQTYYIKVRPNGSNSGTYRIGFTRSTAAPLMSSTAIPLTENIWADGNIPTSSGVQWFTFTATSSTQYIYFSFGTLNSLYVQVYDSGGATVGYETQLYSTTTGISKSLTEEQTYYIRVKPYSSGHSGTYWIGFTRSTAAPLMSSTAIPLTENIWADGNIPTSSGVQWFTFTATSSTQYIHFSFGMLNSLYVQVYDSGGAAVGSQTNLSGSTTNISRTLTAGQTYYIRVSSYSSSNSGTYRIGFNVSSAVPLDQLSSNAIELTENVWADGNLPTSNDVQWFTFTATSSTQYIHFSFGTLYSLYVQVYNSGGDAAGSETSGSTTSNSRSLTAGQTYYIRVRPNGSNSGTYRIAFNTSSAAPNY